jgi:peptide/nickel transport system substrate-binding protein
MGRMLIAMLIAAAVAVAPTSGAATQSPRKGGTAHFGEVTEPACLNVLRESCARAGGWSLSILVDKILEPAFYVGPDFTWRPSLVSGVTFTRKPPFTLTYRIHRRARWSDGVPVTSRDFVFTLRTKIARKSELPEFDRPLLEQVRAVRAVDAKTVQVVLRSRYAGWRALFGNILPRHALAGENLGTIWNDGISNPKTGRPIGSGPFLVERWDRGRQLTLVRNPRYWGPRPAYLNRLVLRFALGSDDPVQWFRSGELDLVWEIFPGGVAALRRERGIRVIATPTPRFEHFAIRVGPGGHPALRSKLVRRALAYGLDRNAIVRQVFGDFPPDVRPLDSLVLGEPSPRYRRNWSAYRRRPAEALRLLQQAGCRRGADGIQVCAGQRLSLRFVTSAGIPPRAQTLTIAQNQLRRVGIEVVPTFAPPPVFLEQILPKGEFDVALFAWQHDPSGTGFEAVFGCGGATNFYGYCQRLVTRDLDQADRILDAGQQGRVLNKADRQMARDVPAIPLFQIPLPAAYRATLRGYVHSTTNPLWNAENLWLADSR